MIRPKTIIKSSKCEGCTHCVLVEKNKLEHVHCNARNKTWLYGQIIEPCHDFTKGEK